MTKVVTETTCEFCGTIDRRDGSWPSHFPQHWYKVSVRGPMIFDAVMCGSCADDKFGDRLTPVADELEGAS